MRFPRNCIVCLSIFAVVGLLVPSRASAAELATQANVPIELTFQAARPHADPFNDVSLDVVFTDPAGKAFRVPAFWDGGDTWKARYASPTVGQHKYQTACSDTTDTGLNGVAGTVAITPYTGDNSLFLHGPVRVAADKRHLEYADGTPFFWLGDTWWMGLAHRLHWPEDFQQLAADRKQKGFTVVQIVAGLYPDMPPFDPRGANDAGFPWEKDYKRIRPEYFDAADKKLQYLVSQGISPCLVGAWGYFMPWMGVDRMKAHWRYLIARYGAYPMFWCAAGEANLPYYLVKGFPYDDREQVHKWTEVLRYIRATDPFRHPLTLHPTAINQYTSRHATDDAALLDFDMLQTPHGQREAGIVAVAAMRQSYAAKPMMPVIDGEASYEMLGDSLPTRWTRAMFWLCMTNGAAGHTYGANGIWQNNRRGDPHGKSPHGGTYGKISWDEAMRLPGSTQESLGKKFFLSLPWTQLEPKLDAATWAAPHGRGFKFGDWIWYPEGDPSHDAPIAARYFRRDFDLPKGVEIVSGLLDITADDKFTVWLNGKRIGDSSDWQHPQSFDVAEELRPGKNVLAVRAENVKSDTAIQNPAGLNAAIQYQWRYGGSCNVTGAEWRVSKTESPGWRQIGFDDSAWPKAKVVAKFGDGPWGKPGSDEQNGGIDPQACGIGDSLLLVYAIDRRPVVIHYLVSNTKYKTTIFDPVSGERTATGKVTTDAQGAAEIQPPHHGDDWVLLLEK